MNCENIFCVYNRKNECTVEPEIGINGFCESCIYVDIDNGYLDFIKENMLKRWEESGSETEDNNE